MIEISPLRPDDRAGWQPLAVGYNAFYERVLPAADYDRTFARLMKARELHGLAARLDGRVIGIAHYMFQASVWFDDVCYLADLFVDETVRGQGAARGLIEAVAGAARTRGCPRYYWLTRLDNARARALYDKVARHVGFIRYDYPMA
ncbi:MAG: GNAT family N-acetyltransferase [Reyranella sp.]|uniref:GNAT family N-acetyltransferase n=1 Tax=Reyranella sp. TaxID=1929291 RepID=UPI00120ED82A|nr:GNAT family N-acetyltransferase [Reyranella sp.]TAJ38198.1 MAG: GNAT family N-acetyltransferase [Reyranella sp.]